MLAPRITPDLRGEPGWTPLTHPAHLMLERNFVSGDPDGDRLRVRYYSREEDLRIFARVWFGPGAEGPPGHAHGGSIAAVLDEAMGVAAWAEGHAVLAARLELDFQRPLALRQVGTVEAWVDSLLTEQKMRTRALLKTPGGALHAEATGLFVHIGMERFTGMIMSTDEEPAAPKYVEEINDL